MSTSGVYYTSDQLNAMRSSISQAQAALSAGDTNGVSTALSNYYNVQINNPSNGSLMRGYAALAQAVATNTGIGTIPNGEVANAVGASTYTDQYRVNLAFQLANADLNVINTNGGQVPTLADDATYHASVFQSLNIPLTAWGGTAYIALGQDFTLGMATAAEQSAITTDQFSNLSASDVSASLMRLLGAGEENVGSVTPGQAAQGAASVVGLDAFAQGKFGAAYSPLFFTISQNQDGTYQVADANDGIYQNISSTEYVNYAVTENSSTSNNSGQSYLTLGGTGVDGTTIDLTGVATVELGISGVSITGGNGISLAVSGSAATIYLSTGDDLSASGGGNTIRNVGAGDAVALSNTANNFDTVYANGDYSGGNAADGHATGIVLAGNTQLNLFSTASVVTVNSGDTLGAYGGGNTIGNVGAGDDIYISGTNGNFDTVGATGDYSGGNASDGQATGIGLDANVQVNISGTANAIVVNSGDTLGAYGGGNIIANVGAGDDIWISGTQGNFDTVNGSGDYTGGNAANGFGTGIFLDANTQVNLGGSADTVVVNSGDSLGAYGGGNTIANVGAGDTIYATGTQGNFDTIDGSGDYTGGNAANGQGTGIYLGANTQANLNGTADTIVVNSGDTLGAYGGGNTIGNVGAGDCVVLGNTNNNFDTVDGSGDYTGGNASNGQGTGIFLNGNTQANLFGTADTVGVSSGDTLGAYGGGNTINNVGAGDDVVLGNTNGNTDTVGANGDVGGGLASNGQGTGISLNDNTQANIVGSGDTVTAGASDFTGIFGNNDTLTANSGLSSFTGTGDLGYLNGTTVYEGANTSLNVVGSGDTVNAGTTDFTGVFGNYDILSATGGSGSFTGVGDIGYDNGTTLAIGNNSSVNIVGNNDVTNLNASDTFGVSGGGDTVDAGSADHVSIAGNSDTYNGSSGTVGITGQGEVVNALDEGVSFGANTTGSGSESGDTIGFGSGDTIRIAGSQDTSYGSNDAITFSGSQDSLSGSNDGSSSGFSNGSGSDPSYDPGDGTDDDDPIILNLSGGAVQTQSLSTSTAYFDMQDSGQAVHTAWLTADEGMLVYDPSGAPVTQDSQLVAGFDALSSLAQGAGGTLDASNPLFDQLRVWVDPSGDAQFQQKDLHTLQALGITSINLASQGEASNSNGNVILNDSTFTWNGGATGDIAGVDLFYTPQSVADTLASTPPQAANDGLAATLQGTAAGGGVVAPPPNSPMASLAVPAGFDISTHASDDPTLTMTAANTLLLTGHAA